MAYKNIKIPFSEEIEYKITDDTTFEPRHLTVCEEKNIKFFKYMNEYEEPHDQYFAMIWNNTAIDINLNQTIVENTVIWDLGYIDIPQNSNLKEDDVLRELKNALKVYGAYGYDFESSYRVEVKTNF